MRVGSPERLREQLRRLGFAPVPGKSGVFEKQLGDTRGRYRLVALTSNKDATLKLYREHANPTTFRFYENYDAVHQFIVERFDL